ncbi:hypothetical protein [Halopiger aswanensis]|uniref:Uncharacterized protein n=1 Tax=Halopiger aswanensis TaxID=148449 RepID=A0A419VV22_9EURY|nr:hypothetical protein [Halopiger aswanensis]RKD85906.1 hypothetical protein ATJ93_4676 [Halopiger aswanensis]
MPEHYEQILEIVAENPGSTVDDIEDLAADHSIADTGIQGLLAEESVTTIFLSLTTGTG